MGFVEDLLLAPGSGVSVLAGHNSGSWDRSGNWGLMRSGLGSSW